MCVYRYRIIFQLIRPIFVIIEGLSCGDRNIKDLKIRIVINV